MTLMIIKEIEPNIYTAVETHKGISVTLHTNKNFIMGDMVKVNENDYQMKIRTDTIELLERSNLSSQIEVHRSKQTGTEPLHTNY